MARSTSYIDHKKLKVFLPVIAGMFIPVAAYVIYMSYNPLVIGQDSNSAIYGLWIVNNIILPVLLVVLLLIQWLIILPWWNRIASGKKLKAAFILVVVIIFIALGMGYITWSPAFSLNRLILSIVFVFIVQLIYWVFNVLVLFIIDKPRISKLKSR